MTNKSPFYRSSGACRRIGEGWDGDDDQRKVPSPAHPEPVEGLGKAGMGMMTSGKSLPPLILSLSKDWGRLGWG